ncbi:MAG: alpha/beta hydrolase [Alistipes sp.]|nr:alpha/beta hydrolase [Alistipes sp.]
MDYRYKYNGIELSYSIEGEGDAVILLHGWGCDKSIWKSSIEVLRSNFRVVAVDFAGFGASEEPETIWGVEEYTCSVEALLKELNIQSPTLVGHSFGGRVSILYASRNEVKSVVLTDAAGVKPRRSFSYYRKVYTYKLLKRALPLLIGEKKAQMLLDQRRAKSGSSDYNRATPMMRAILSKCVNEDLCYAMPKISAPTLLFWGDMDTATPISDAHKMAKLILDAGLVVAEGAGHFAFLERPGLWLETLKSFLKFE